MLCVAFDANGELDLATKDDCDGLIWTPEGKKDPDAANYKLAIGGRKYTMFKRCELVEAEIGTSPALVEGDKVYAFEGGDVVTTDTAGQGNIYIGQVVKNGSRIVVDVNGKLPL